MKKNFTFKKIFAGAMIATLLFSMSAVASEKNTKPLLISPAQETQKENEMQTQYQLVQGTISGIEKEKDYTKIQIDNDDMGMIFTVESDVFVIDQKDNSYQSIQDLKKGMEITAVLSNNSIMTMSIPPMTPGAAGFIINAEGSFTDLSAYNEDLTNSTNTLKLNIDEKTVITDIRGSKKAFSKEDLKNNELLVFYSASTRSIPAQTSPSFVMILASAAMEETAPEPQMKLPAVEIQQTEKKAPELVALRDLAEKAGFTIQWTANDKPIVLEKENTKIEITVGKNTYLLNGKENSFSLETKLNDSKVFVSSELETILQ